MGLLLPLFGELTCSLKKNKKVKKFLHITHLKLNYFFCLIIDYRCRGFGVSGAIRN
jgi:hypothetical protein